MIWDPPGSLHFQRIEIRQDEIAIAKLYVFLVLPRLVSLIRFTRELLFVILSVVDRSYHRARDGLVGSCRALMVSSMAAFFRTLPNTLWWITLALAIVALLTQIAVAVARSGAVSVEQLLAEFVFTLAFLVLPVGIAWRGRQQGSLWYAAGALVLLLALAKIFFF
jgi:hypothetical protein